MFRIPSSPRFNRVQSLKKLCQAVVGRNDEVNLQPTLNKGAGGARLTTFVIDCVFYTFEVTRVLSNFPRLKQQNKIKNK